MRQFTVNSIGTIQADHEGCFIQLHEQYIPALAGLVGFRHVQVLWWFDGCDTPACRGNLQERSPYRTAPPALGVFATRSPSRPNPLALSCSQVIWIDEPAGRIGVAWIDADDGTPVLDIKPYTPSLDRVEHPGVPDWCAHWPSGVEASGDFDWEAEMTFRR